MAQVLRPITPPVLAGPQLRWSRRQLALTLLLLSMLAWLLLSFGDGSRLGETALGLWTRPDLVLVFLLTYTVAFLLRAAAWQMLIPGGPRLTHLFAILHVALLANHLFPTKAGEVVRIGLLIRRGVSTGLAISSTTLARLLDFAALCLIALTLGPLAGGRLDVLLGSLALPLAVVGLGGLGYSLLAAGRLSPLWSRLPARVAGNVRQAQAAVGAAAPTRTALAFGVVLVSWLLEAGALWATAQAAGVPLTLAVAAAATAFTIVFQAFPVTPGGLGVYEATLTAGLALYGVEPTAGLALAMVTHGLKFAYAYLAGFLALLAESSDGIGRVVPVQRLAAIGRAVGSGVALASIAYLATQPGALATASTWRVLLVGLLATAPLVVLGCCHHLPMRLTPIFLAVPLLFLALFGLPAPTAGLLAVALAGLAAVWRRSTNPVAIVGPGLLAQSIAAGSQQAVAVVLFGLTSLGLLILIRQWWLAHRPLPLPGPPPGSLLAVLIPVHNEAATIAAVVAGVPRALLKARGLEPLVVVVDDGSTDGSGAIARAAGADVVIGHPACRGLGAALRTGLRQARERQAGVAVYLDGDGEYDPADILAVLEPIRRGEADYVLGSRFPQAGDRMCRSRRWGNQAFTVLLRLLTGRGIADGQTGFRGFSARALATAEILHDYNYAQVLTLDLLRKRMRLAQVPIKYCTRRQGTSFIRYREYLGRVLPAMAREILGP